MSPGRIARIRASWLAFRPSSRAWFAIACVALVVNSLGWWCVSHRATAPAKRTPLAVVSTSPTGIALVDATVRVAFDRPMAMPSDVGHALPQSPLSLSPHTPGAAVWVSDRVLELKPTRPLFKATGYTVSLSSSIRALDGSTLATPLRFIFETPRLQLLDAHQAGAAQDGLLPISLQFDDDVHAAKLKEKLRFHDAHGGTLEYTLDRTGMAREFRACLTAGTQDSGAVHLEIESGLVGASGPLPMFEVWRAVNVSNTCLRVERHSACAPGEGDPYVYVEFSDSVDPERARPNVSVTPQVALRLEQYYHGLRISGAFQPGGVCTLTLSRGLTSEHGMTLTSDVVLPVAFSDRPKEIHFAHPGQVLAREGHQELCVDSTNVSAAWLHVHRLYANNIVHFLKCQRHWRRYGVEDVGWQVAEQEVPIQASLNQPTRTVVDLKKLLPGTPSGAYLITVSKSKDDDEGDERVVLSTDLGLTAKVSRSGLVAWVCSLSKGEPLAGIEVKAWTRTNQALACAASDEHGIATLELPEEGDREPFLVTATRGDDFSFVELEGSGWDLRPFGPEGAPTVVRGYRAFLYTDRGVYRGGESVHVAGLLRDARRMPPKPFPLDLSVERDDRTLWRRVRVKPDEQGAFETQIEVPDDARTGTYRAWVTIPSEKDSLGQVTFQVEDFVPERMKVALKVPEGLHKPGEKFDVKLSAQHLFGAPAADRQAEATVVWNGVEFTSPEFPDYRFGDPARKVEIGTSSLGEKTLDSNGETTYTIEAPTAKPPAMLEGLVRGTVLEPGGRAACASAKIRVAGYPVLLGIRRIDSGATRPGQPREVDIVALTPEGKPASIDSVDVKVSRIEVFYALRRDATGLKYDWTRKTEPVTEAKVALSEGRGVYQFNPPEWGDFELSVEDPQGGMRTTIEVWAWGSGEEASAQARESVKVLLDKPSYLPGETARVRIETPFAGEALVCLERERVLAWKVVHVAGRAAELEFPVGAECAPNVYCTATVIQPVTSTAKWHPHRAFGMAQVPVSTEAHQLSVKMESAEEAKPGDPVVVTLRVAAGEAPVRDAVVTVAAVDEGILQLTRFRSPDPHACFFAKEALATRSHDLYTLLFPELDDAASSAPGGDGGGKEIARLPKTAPMQARRFVSTALWFSGLRTDAEGRVHVKTTLPAYHGELRWMAVAARDASFGSAEQPMRVAPPLLLEVSAPRFAGTGDTFEATVTLTNRTGEEGTAHVTSAASEGISAVDSNSRSDMLAAGAERTWRIPLRCDAVTGTAKLSIHATLGSEAAEESISLPVRPPAERVTLAQSGRIERGSIQSIDVPASWIEGTGRTHLVLTARPALRLTGDLKKLLEYPYGCVEQTTSRAFPLLYLEDMLALIDPKAAGEHGARTMVRAAIARLETMQTRSGGLSMWPGGERPYDWGTAYATHFLVEARRAGYDVPSHLLDNAMDYLREALEGRSRDEANAEVQAYAAFVLAMEKRVTLSDLSSLRERAGTLAPTAAGHLAAALAALGRGHEATAVIAASSLAATQRRDTGGTLHSAVRDDALLLTVLLEAAPDHPKIGELVERLEAAEGDGGWSTTHETAWALVALGKYAAQGKETGSVPLTGAVLHGQRVLQEFKAANEVHYVWNHDGPGHVEVMIEGAGPVFYRWEAEGIPEGGAAPDIDRGLRVRRRFLDEKGQPIESLRVQQGELVTVELSLEADGGYSNCVVRDLLPTGFEAENLRLAHRGRKDDADRAEHTEYRDDRVELFLDVRPETTRTLRYVMRAVTPGRCVMPQSRAFCMYHPTALSLWGRVEWEVVPR